MATTAENVAVALTGGVYYAPAGTALPTDATTTLNVAFDELGYITEEGVSQMIEESTTKIRAWQNGDTVREVQTAHDLMYGFTCLETNENVLAVYYGNYAAGVVEVNAAPGTRGCWVFQIADGDQDIRIVVPDGQVTDRGDISYVNGNAISYPMQITCYPDADYNGSEDQPAKAYIYYSPAIST